MVVSISLLVPCTGAQHAAYFEAHSRQMYVIVRLRLLCLSGKHDGLCCQVFHP